VAAVAAVAGASGSFYVGLSRVDPWSLGVLGTTLVIVVVVLAVTAYKMLDRVLRHLEEQPRSP
jgi:hypothetical protein